MSPKILSLAFLLLPACALEPPLDVDSDGDGLTDAEEAGSSDCDINDYVWRANGGNVTDANDLPIKHVYTGDTGDSGEQAIMTIGPLRVF